MNHNFPIALFMKKKNSLLFSWSLLFILLLPFICPDIISSDTPLEFINIKNIKTYPPFDEKYSIIFATHKPRINYMRQQLKKLVYGQSKYLDQIFIYWIDRYNPLPVLSDFLNNTNITVPIHILESPNISITDRFLVPQGLRTETVISSDDDLQNEAKSLDLGFEIYCLNHLKNRIFGLTRRNCDHNSYSLNLVHNKYNLVLTNFAYLNIKMLELFNSKEYIPLVKAVQSFQNGEDILMNFIVSHNFKASPIACNFPKVKAPDNGISMEPGHFAKRDKCCLNFPKLFGYDVPQMYFSHQILPLKLKFFDNL